MSQELRNPVLSINNLFLLGAGFTKSVFPDAPLNSELLARMIDFYPEGMLAKFKNKYSTDDIEILLTFVDLEIAKRNSDGLINSRHAIENEIADFFRQFRFREDVLEGKDWLRMLALDVLGENDAIITLNYDCFLEGLLNFFKVWSPKEGYVNIDNPLADCPKNIKGIKIYKIHGSENFIPVPISDRSNQQYQYLGYQIDEHIYPCCWEHRHFGLSSQRYVIAPSFVKCPHVLMADMVNKAIRAAGSARLMVIGGCGMRKEDISLWLMVTSFLNGKLDEEDEKKELIILDPNAENIKDRIEDYWVGTTKHVCFRAIKNTFEKGTSELVKMVN